jgi:hypothetical protein
LCDSMTFRSNLSRGRRTELMLSFVSTNSAVHLRRTSLGTSPKWFPPSTNPLGARGTPRLLSMGTYPPLFDIIRIKSVGLSPGASGSETSMQKLCSFARAFTKAITLLMLTLAEIADLRTPHLLTNCPNAHSTLIRNCR